MSNHRLIIRRNNKKSQRGIETQNRVKLGPPLISDHKGEGVKSYPAASQQGAMQMFRLPSLSPIYRINTVDLFSVVVVNTRCKVSPTAFPLARRCEAAMSHRARLPVMSILMSLTTL